MKKQYDVHVDGTNDLVKWLHCLEKIVRSLIRNEFFLEPSKKYL